MRFRLVYEGEIPPRQRGDIKDIHGIRMALHPQLRQLWEHLPLLDARASLRETAPDGDIAILERRNGVLFAPLVTQNNNLSCELSVLFLRQQAPGQLIAAGGDIDNRIKTLLDALRMPSTAEAQQAEVVPPDDPSEPIHCLLQDDGLVTRLDVETDRLLKRTPKQFDMLAIIHVRVVVTRQTWGNIGLSS